MSVQSPGKRANLRLWLVALAIIIFVWSGLEDHDVIGVTILGAGLASTLFGWKLASRFKSSTRPWLTIAAISGAMIGALACLMTVAADGIQGFATRSFVSGLSAQADSGDAGETADLGYSRWANRHQYRSLAERILLSQAE